MGKINCVMFYFENAILKKNNIYILFKLISTACSMHIKLLWIAPFSVTKTGVIFNLSMILITWWIQFVFKLSLNVKETKYILTWVPITYKH